MSGGVDLAKATSPSGAAAYVPISPCRLADTRPGPYNVGSRTTPVGPDEVLNLEGRGGTGNCTGPAALPTDTTGLQLNVTAVNATRATFLTLYPSGADRPTVSNLNPTPGSPPVPNAVAVKLADDGRFAVFNRFGSVDVIVDVVGFYTDHHHDDRYYTRAEVDGLIASPDEPWVLDISPQATSIWPAGSDDRNASSYLPNNQLTSTITDFKLPSGYQAGADLDVEVMWSVSTPSDCEVFLSSRGVRAGREGRPVAHADWLFTEPSNPIFPWRSHVIVDGVVDGDAVVRSMTLRITGDALEPGDWLRVTLERDGLDPSDTCDQPLQLFGSSVQEA